MLQVYDKIVTQFYFFFLSHQNHVTRFGMSMWEKENWRICLSYLTSFSPCFLICKRGGLYQTMISRLPSSCLAPMSPLEVNWEHLSSERELQSNMRANMKFNVLKHFQNQHCLKEASSVLWQIQCHQIHGFSPHGVSGDLLLISWKIPRYTFP